MLINQLITVNVVEQNMLCFDNDHLRAKYPISTGKNGLGEQKDTGMTPRGWHRVHQIIGNENLINSVFIARKWTGEIYSTALHEQNPERDWILTRIIRLDGLEAGRNKGGEVDSLERYIYIHGTPDCTQLGIPGSKGCIRMSNRDIIELTGWLQEDALVYIQAQKFPAK